MRQFGSKDDFPRRIVDYSYSGGLAAWVQLETQWLKLGLCDGPFQDNREGVATKHGGLPS